MGNTHDSEIARIEADYIKTKYRSQDDYRWGYIGDRGPETWWVYYPSASGGNQSPIDVVTEDTLVDYDFGFSVNPLKINYSTTNSGSATGASSSTGHQAEGLTLVNTGTTARVDVGNSRSYISGGPCKEYSYKLERLHLHWGEDDEAGSEHLVNSSPFAAELQLVHWNEDAYDSYEEAVKREDGIVILAVFVMLTDDKSNDGLSNIVSGLDDVTYRDQTVQLEGGSGDNTSLTRSFLPGDTTRYWSYRGSFTMPPCYETVTWIILQDPIRITRRDLSKFRRLRTYGDTEMRLHTGPAPTALPISAASSQRAAVASSSTGDGDDGLICSNCRPVQPRGTRRIRVPPTPTLDDAHHAGGFATGLHSRRTISLLPGRASSIDGNDALLHHQQPFLVQQTVRLATARMATFPAEVVGQ